MGEILKEHLVSSERRLKTFRAVGVSCKLQKLNLNLDIEILYSHSYKTNRKTTVIQKYF